MAALIDRAARRHLKQPNRPVLLGVDLASAKEEAFCIMVCDGLSVAAAFVRAGFTSKASNAALALFHKPHIQARAQAILEARRTQGVVTLPEVTSMLQRVFAGALHDAEYSAAHNAAFSLARLYGHVTDRATLEVIRRPSRDPDAPSEQALSSWVEALPGLAGPGLAGPSEASFVRLADAPAAPLGLDTPGPEPRSPNDFNDLAKNEQSFHQPRTAGPGPSGPELFNDIKWLGPATPGRPENGAPSTLVTEAPNGRARAGLLEPDGRARAGLLETTGPEGTTPPGGREKGAPLNSLQVPVLTGEFPPIEDLF